MKWLCKIRHKWGAWGECDVEDGDNLLASRAYYRECARCHRKEVITYLKTEFEISRLLYEVNRQI
jgi:hypothetical protein